MASTALDIITGALLGINSYSPGEPLDAADGQAGLNALNDLLDSLSADKAFVYTQVETLYNWIAGKYQYSVGNPVGGTFSGTLTGGSPTISSVLSIPPDLIVGGTLSDIGAAIPSGTLITAIGSTTISMGDRFGNPVNAFLTPIPNPEPITYTVPGDIPMGRPLRFNDGFTRSTTSGNSNLDYAFEMISFDRYKEELLKNVQGPWPYVATYQPTFPYGTLYVYPCPGANYQAHIFTDLILSGFDSLTAAYAMPQGYTRALKKLLSLELCPQYGKTPSSQLIMQAKEAKALIKTVNDSPVKTLRFDTAIQRQQVNDASWAQNGGFT
jgi:hypothetical protein